ncbi:tetratricopeptide repeat protein [Aeromonas jandaei]|uniref:tetratricopeptide repeat protein n=1 Tax=Aeromonas jandaei TaxID=650 RepID=UPI0035B4A8B9
MNQLFFLAMMMSSLSAPNLDLDKEQLSVDLQQAQSLVQTDPARCVQITSAFLTRAANNPQQIISNRQEFGYREPILNYSTIAQSVGAYLLKGECLLQLGQYQATQQALDKAMVLADKENLPELKAHGLYLKIRSQLLKPDHQSSSRPLLSELEEQLTAPNLKQSQLQIYSRLLRTSYDIDNQQLEDAKVHLAEARNWAAKAGYPLASAWVSAISGDLYRALQQPQLALGEYIDAQQQAKHLNDPLFLGLLSNQIVKLYQQEQEPQKALQYANEAANYFHSIGNPSLLCDSLIVLARLNRDQGDLNLALVYFFNALDLIDEGSNRPQSSLLKYEIGKTYLQSGNLSLASNYLNAARQSHELNDAKEPLIDTLLLLGELYLKKQEAAIAILQLENARALADQIGDTRRQYEVFRLLSLAYEQKGFLRQALDSYKRFHRLGEEVRQQEIAQEQAAIRDNYVHVERVQHIKELEQQLSQSQHQQERYLWSSITTSLLLALFIYLFFTLWLKLRTARLQAKRTGEALLIEPRSGLANWQRLMNRWPREMAKRQLKSERWYLSEEPTSEFDDKLHYLLFRVPFLLNVREQHGYQASSEIEQAFGAYIETLTPQDGRIYDLREGHLLYVVPQRHVANLHQLAGDLLIAIAAFPCDYPIDRRVSLGIVSHPFLPKAATALDHHGLFDLCYLALSGAIQLSEKHQQNVWLELAAIDCQQAAFFNGDVWQCALMAIDKGLVKVNSSHEKQWVNWHQLARKQDTGPQP